MKIINYLALFVCLTGILFISSCDNEPEAEKQGRLEFSINADDLATGGRAKTLAAVLVSVEDADGNVIHERKSLPLINFGGEYLTEAISLTVGSFKLTEFIVVDENNVALYATPLEGSPLAHLVNDPLPMEFTVNKDETTKVRPQVVKVDGFTGPDFGYATFSFDIVDTFKFYVGVMAYNEATSNFELTDAHVAITSQTETLYDRSITAETSEITIEDGFSDYTLSVAKSGYLPYEKVFTDDELKAFGTGTPLVVTLLDEGLAEGLIAYYPFNGNAEDQTENNFDGAVHGAALTSDRKGTANAAYSFDGIDDYISVAHDDALNLPGDFTISLWTNISSSQVPHEGINDILRKWTGNHEGYPFAIAYLNSTASDDVEDKLVMVRYDGQGCGNGPQWLSPTITNDTFVHIVFVKTGSTLKVYLDNNLAGEFTDDTACSVGNTADMTIGCRGNLVRFFKGMIDDIRIYNRALSASEVASLHAE